MKFRSYQIFIISIVLMGLGVFAIAMASKANVATINLKEEKLIIEELMNENDSYENRISELEAVRTKSESDISDYILTYFKTVSPIVAEEVAKQILQASGKHDVPFVTLVAITEVESQFNPAARSNKGARGLMQVMPKYWKEELNLKSKYDLHNIQIGINSGAYVMNKYLGQTNNDMKKALYKYVGGDNTYVKNVYEAMGKFVVFRSFANMTVTEEVIPVIDNDVVESTSSEEYIHTVTHRGEMLGTISKWYTGDLNKWRELLKANPHIIPDRMPIGAKITIPRELLKTITPMTKEFVNENLPT